MSFLIKLEFAFSKILKFNFKGCRIMIAKMMVSQNNKCHERLALSSLQEEQLLLYVCMYIVGKI